MAPAGVYHILVVIGSISRHEITAIGGVMRFKEADFGSVVISLSVADKEIGGYVTHLS